MNRYGDSIKSGARLVFSTNAYPKEPKLGLLGNQELRKDSLKPNRFPSLLRPDLSDDFICCE